MNPRVKEVVPNNDYTINIIFDNGEEKVFDVKPYLDKGIFKELREPNMFKSVKPFMGSIQWKHGQDFCPDTLYLASNRITKRCSCQDKSETMGVGMKP